MVLYFKLIWILSPLSSLVTNFHSITNAVLATKLLFSSFSFLSLLFSKGSGVECIHVPFGRGIARSPFLDIRRMVGCCLLTDL